MIQAPLGGRQGVIICIEFRFGPMTCEILYIDLRISFKKRYQILRASQEDNLCVKGSGNHANVRNNGRNWECPRWEKEGRELGKLSLVL